MWTRLDFVIKSKFVTTQLLKFTLSQQYAEVHSRRPFSYFNNRSVTKLCTHKSTVVIGTCFAGTVSIVKQITFRKILQKNSSRKILYHINP